MTTVIQPEPVPTYHLIARDRAELQQGHARMVEWAEAKLDRVDLDVQVETAALEAAVAHGFTPSPFERRITRLERQRGFYVKILTALNAGYIIVPNFQMTVFAVRTNAAHPHGTPRTGRWNRFVQPARLLPIGEGRYVNPDLPTVEVKDETRDAAGDKLVVWHQWPDDEFKDLAFPMVLAKPELMNAAGEAMARKLFDEVGVAVDTYTPTRGGGRVDPILLARLLNPRPGRPALTFFLGWYFDPSRL